MAETYIQVSLHPTASVKDCLDFITKIKQNSLVKEAKTAIRLERKILDFFKRKPISSAQFLKRRQHKPIRIPENIVPY